MFKSLDSLLRATMDFILRHPLIFWACVIANLFGAVFGGWFWYGPMLLNSPVWALPFIPDCPLAALLGAVGLLALKAGREWRWFYALTAFACLKYGAWTVFYWLYAWDIAGFVWNPIEIMLFVTHIGLFIEGLLFVPAIGLLSLTGRLVVISWFALSIYVDYWLRFHPPLGPVPMSFAMWAAIVLTVVLSLGLLVLPYKRKQEKRKTFTYMGMAE